MWRDKCKASPVQGWRKTAKNLHQAFGILEKICHKSNFSPTEGGVFWQAAPQAMICSIHTVGFSSQIKSVVWLG